MKHPGAALWTNGRSGRNPLTIVYKGYSLRLDTQSVMEYDHDNVL